MRTTMVARHFAVRQLAVCTLLLGILLHTHTASAIQFYLRDNEERCLSEDVQRGDLMMGDYSSDGTITVTITDNTGVSVFQRTHTGGEGKFAYTAGIAGDYKCCFRNMVPGQRHVSFTLRTGLDTKDYSAAAKKDSLKPLEVELRRLEDTVTAIHNDLMYMLEREDIMRKTNDSTASRVLWFSFFSMFVLVSLAFSQILYLKRYFQSKKLID